MRVTVTGSHGYIGASLVYALRGASLAAVQCIDLKNPEGAQDICDPSTRLAISKFEPDILFNLAALSGETACRKEPARAWAVNYDVVRGLRLSAPKAVFVQASTASVLGDLGRETTPYAHSKLQAEMDLARMDRTLVFRFGTVFGAPVVPGLAMRWDTPFNRMVQTGVQEGVIRVWGPRKWRPWIELNALVWELVRVLERPNCCGSVPVGLCQFNRTMEGMSQLARGKAAYLRGVSPRVEIQVESDGDERDYCMWPTVGESLAFTERFKPYLEQNHA